MEGIGKCVWLYIPLGAVPGGGTDTGPGLALTLGPAQRCAIRCGHYFLWPQFPHLQNERVDKKDPRLRSHGRKGCVMLRVS